MTGSRIRFEKTRSLTDPRVADTDGDGIPDGAEDPDRDKLRNVWEQWLSLDPLRKDTDGDGIPDGKEDNDHDGLTNHFELHWNVTDPRTNDSDLDGLRDSAEDPDHDGLANRGEQRFGTSPTKADTDGDGRRDGRDDANGNGRQDAAEQDSRPVPHQLVPTLAGANADAPQSYTDGCGAEYRDPWSEPCVYGDVGGSTTVVLFGDSHAAQWLPALIRVGAWRGWRIVSITKSACPSADVYTWDKELDQLNIGCVDYRHKALAWMRDNPPDVVLVTSKFATVLYLADGSRVPRGDREARWQKGLARTLGALPSSAKAVVLADTPYPGSIEVPPCLMAHQDRISDCVRPRALMVNAAHAAAEHSTARAAGATFANLTPEICPYDPCPVIIDELLLWRDHSHITATYSRTLARSLGPVLDAVVSRP